MAWWPAAVTRPAPTLLVSNEVGMGAGAGDPTRANIPGHDRAWPTSAWRSWATEIYAAVMGVVLRLHPEPLRVFRGGRDTVSRREGAVTEP